MVYKAHPSKASFCHTRGLINEVIRESGTGVQQRSAETANMASLQQKDMPLEIVPNVRLSMRHADVINVLCLLDNEVSTQRRYICSVQYLVLVFE